MELVQESYHYLLSNWIPFQKALGVHVSLSLTALLMGSALAIPLGVLSARLPVLASLAVQMVGAVRVVPSLAILVLLLPYLGLGSGPALVALTILATPPILYNTYVAFRDVDPAVVEAAEGMGMSRPQVMWWIQTPLALPVVMAGLRTAAVEVTASATLAAFVGGGGLGEFIINGLAMNDLRLLLVGAVPVALLALLTEGLFAFSEHLLRRLTR